MTREILTATEVVADIKRQMRERQITQAALARDLGVSPTSISFALTGERLPTPRVLAHFGFARFHAYRRVR